MLFEKCQNVRILCNNVDDKNEWRTIHTSLTMPNILVTDSLANVFITVFYGI